MPMPKVLELDEIKRLIDIPQLIQAIEALTDVEASPWPAATAPSCKWHLWHMARWADYVQALLSPVVDTQSPELWEFAGVADEWGFVGVDLIEGGGDRRTGVPHATGAADLGYRMAIAEGEVVEFLIA